MSVLQDLLEYQKVDSELGKIENELRASEEYKTLSQARKAVRTAEQKIAEEDARAKELTRLRDEISARVEEAERAIKEYEDMDELVAEGGGDVSFYKRNAQQLAEKLRAAKAELSRILSEAEALSKEYSKMMEQGKKMMAVYKEYSEKYRVLQEARAPEQKEIEKKLIILGKNIPEDLLERYKQKRNERILPVIVPLAGETCICGMDFPLAQRNKLSGGNLIECENCHRLIYKS